MRIEGDGDIVESMSQSWVIIPWSMIHLINSIAHWSCLLLSTWRHSCSRYNDNNTVAYCCILLYNVLFNTEVLKLLYLRLIFIWGLKPTPTSCGWVSTLQMMFSFFSRIIVFLRVLVKKWKFKLFFFSEFRLWRM